MFGKPPKHSQDEEYTVIPVIPYEDEPEHNPSGFCGNLSHECHENQDSINELNQARLDGEVSDADANRIYRGKTVGGW